MIIAHNLSALNSLNRLNQNNKATSNTLEKLSSGYRINRGADDAAGLAISEKMRAQIRGLEKAQQNIQDGISLIQTAEGGLGSIHNPNLVRLRELAIQAANDTLTDADRKLIQKEVEQIKQGIDEIANNTEFNGIKLLNSEADNPKIIGTEIITTTIPGYYEATPSIVDLSKAASITIFENSSSIYSTMYSISNLENGQFWKVPSSVGLEEYVFSVDLANNTFTTTALYKSDKSSYPGNNITGVRLNGLTGYEDTEVWASEVVAHSQATFVYGLNILGDNTKDESGFSFNLPYDTFITVNFKSKKYIPEVVTTATQPKVVYVPDILKIQTGANEGQNLEIELADARTKALGIDQLDYSTRLGAEAAIAKIDAAIEKVSAQRGKFGAYQNRLEYTYNNSTNYSMNLTAAESRIRDADMAKETMKMVKSQILTQASQTMLAHANQQPESVLSLLQ